MLKYSLIFVPQILSLLMQLLFPSDFSTNKKVFFQPPGFVFGIVWTLIYILLGFYLYSLVQQRKSNKYFTYMLTIFVFNLLFNFSWAPIVNNQKKYIVGIFLIALMIFTLFLLISIDTKPVNRSLLIPYLSWLFLALLLNVELARST